MSHEITERPDGTAEAAFAMTPAWHGLGTVLDHAMTSAEALEAAQLDWEVEQWPVGVAQMPDQEDCDQEEESSSDVSDSANPYEAAIWHPQSGVFGNVRSDNGTLLGLVSSRYQVVQNIEAFAFLDALIEEESMEYEAAFSLRGGKMVCLLARMPSMVEIVDGDAVVRYLLMSLTHDATGSIKFGPCSTRVVCNNTYQVALGEGTVKDLAIPHVGNINEKLDRARQIIGLANDEFGLLEEQYKQLAQAEFSHDDWRRYLDILCPIPDEADPDYTKRRADNIIDTRTMINACYTNERQALAPNTAWAAFNAVTEHIDHLPRRGATPQSKAEARFNVTMYGAGRDQKERAFVAACRIAGIDCQDTNVEDDQE